MPGSAISTERARPSLAANGAVPQRPGVLFTLWRMVRWNVALVRLGCEIGMDRLRGVREPRAVGRRLRSTLERLGGTAVKLGQQLAIRVDLLPSAVCEELGELLDAVPPFEFAYALERIEAVTGRPWQDTFTQLNPEPIGSASVACVFRGTLRSGEEVAVKIRRPDVQAQFKADLAVIVVYTTVLEVLTVVRPGFFSKLRDEMIFMFEEELDFKKEARYQRLFRQFARKRRIRWLDAPGVHSALCGDDMLVSDFVEGVPCTELLRVVESRDTEALEALKLRRIDPAKIGLRIWLVSLIGRCEMLFFHGDPHPGNMIIQPGNRIMFMDFGACGLNDAFSRLFTYDIYLHQMRDEIGLASESGLGLLWPLPALDMSLLREQSLASFRATHHAWRDPDAPWFERTTASLWLSFLEIAREHRIPMTRNTLRNLRSTLLYDTLSGRLQGSQSYEEFGRYAKRAERRYLRWRRRVDRLDDVAVQQVHIERQRIKMVALGQELTVADHRLGSARFLPMVPSIRKLAWMVRTVVRLFVLLATLVGSAWLGLSASNPGGITLGETLSQPWLVVPIALVLALSTRWILLRMDELR
ncbi:MAG: hypothetical protein CL927_15355 [Deltaproteobacteria bacterium]|nr:hypothetical protein [Deltaproteobacteria bacterium]